jgi:glutamine amidotransferase
MSAIVTVIDYGSGNLLSVTRALEHCGATVELSDDPARIAVAERLVLPGVGAFADGMAGLSAAALIDPIRAFAASGRPLMGICLGMQMLASYSDEFGANEGLGLIPGRVTPIPDRTADGEPHKIPHIGWADLILNPGRESADTCGIADGDAVYLVHSYRFEPEANAHRLADCIYGGLPIAAAIRAGNITGFQFHPEKSGKVGLGILDAFLKR